MATTSSSMVGHRGRRRRCDGGAHPHSFIGDLGPHGTPPAAGNEWRVNMDVEENGSANAADLGLVASKFGGCP
jgi:hypothetical protein